ncbi:MAG: nuclear transport factor 2 family protein [Acidobacteriota bacterium]|nr:nuclear transport factor 2 family protein [Acidobacteriota bacterium]
MKLILISLAMIIAIPSFILGQATSQNISCEQTAKELESKITKITQDLDKAAFEEFVSEDVIIIRADGETTSKKEQSASFSLPSGLVFSFTTEDIKIRACGEMSIVTTGKDIIKATEKKSKKSATQNYWFTRVYEKRQGRWQLVFNQLTSTNE